MHFKSLKLFVLLFLCVSAYGITENDDAVRHAYQAGETAIQQGDLAAAEKAFLHVLELVPQDVGARANLGVVYMREQKWNRALDYLKQAEKLAPQVAGIRLNIGLVHYRQGDYKSAIPAFESVLNQQPDSSQARRLLGLCYLFVERYPAAATELEPLWPASNTDVSYLYSLAVAAGNAGRHDLESRAASQLAAIGKDSPFVHLLLGKAYIAHEDYPSALAELQKASDADEKLPMVHYNLGIVYRHQGELDQARAEFLKDVALEPNVAFNYDQLGLLASADGKDHQAEAYFLEAVKRDPALGTSWFGLAKTYKQEKQYTAALNALQHAGAIDPASASVHYLRAQVLAAQGRKEAAQLEFAAVQKLKKDNIDKLEREITGTKYRDPAVIPQP